MNEQRVPRWATSVQSVDYVTSIVRDEVARLEAELSLPLSALSAVGNHVESMRHRSARVDSLGLHLLPPAFYVEHCIAKLRAEIVGARMVGRPSRRLRARVGELRELLIAVVDITANVDVAGELDLPFELVSTAQSGARSGISCLDRISQALESIHLPPNAEPRSDAEHGHPNRSAEWMLQVTGRILPPLARDRYVEEFRGELYYLAEEGANLGAQLAYVFRQVGRLWSTRRALPEDLRYRARDSGKVAASRNQPAIVRAHYFSDVVRAYMDRRAASAIIRAASSNAKREKVFRRGSRGARSIVQVQHGRSGQKSSYAVTSGRHRR